MQGQLRLKESSVLIIGAGGLGSPALLYLAAAGVGRLGIVDFDVVDASNMHRQIIHGSSDIGKSKLDSAEKKLKDINPNVQIIKHETRLRSENALSIISQYDLVVDGTDNFPTRYLVNDACVFLGKPNVYGSIFQFDGQATVFCVADGPCYRCLYPEPPPPGTVPSCAEGGVLGILPGVVGLIQATETIKLILGIGESLVGRLILYDALAMTFRELRISRDPNCLVCGDNPSVRELIDYESFCGLSQKSNKEISPSELKAMLEQDEAIALIDVREPYEFEINRISGSQLIPLGELQSRISELKDKEHVVVYCLSGSRSADACRILRDAGIENALNLSGGIRAWIEQIELDMASY